MIEILATGLTSPWSLDHRLGMVAAFLACGVESRCVPRASGKNPVYVEDFGKIASLPAGVPTFAYLHTTAAWSLFPSAESQRASEALASKLTFGLVATQFAFAACQPLTLPRHIVGWPGALPHHPHHGAVYKRILVAGRFTLTRHPLLMAEALHRAAALGFEVVFATPVAPEPPLAYHGLPKGMRVEVMSPARFAQAAAASHSVVVASSEAGDTLNVSAAQCVLAGIPVAAPNHGPFPEYVASAGRYKPFHLDSILDTALYAPTSDSSRLRTFVGPEQAAAKLLPILRQYQIT